jgi:alpha-ketoglutarate-dependent taurine dioxygenase
MMATLGSLSQRSGSKGEAMSVEFPKVLELDPRSDTRSWVENNRTSLTEYLYMQGAVLLRNTGIDSAEMFNRVADAFSQDVPTLTQESSPRSVVHGRVMTSTDYPNIYPIQFHSEYSYASAWPMRLLFCCLQQPESSGETPIADNRIVLANMRPSTRAIFEQKGVTYIRNYRPYIGVSWQSAFGTTKPDDVEAACRSAKIEYEWRAGGILQTRQRGRAVLNHPLTGEPVWFNHAFFFNARALEPVEVREALLSYPESDPLSINTLFGDDTPIGADIIEELRSLYASASSRWPWRRGDILIIDNMLTSHARAPFRGARNVVVVMADGVSRESVERLAKRLDGQPASLEKRA